jgi:hypothetical protein
MVKDLTSGNTQEISRNYELLPQEFGLVRYSVTRDPQGKVRTQALTAGKPGFINFSAVGFAHDPTSGQPDVKVEMRVVSDQGRQALKPIVGEVKQGVASKAAALPMQFEVEFPQSGQFTVELSATDRLAGKTATLKVPLTVQPGK